MTAGLGFRPIQVGTLAEQISMPGRISPIPDQHIIIHFPARLEAMALDPSKVAERGDRIYRAGQIDFIIAIFKHVTVRIVEGREGIFITETTARRSLVMHAAKLMQQVLGFKESIEIDVKEDVGLRHCGLGSSSGTIAAVATAINELYSKPLSAAMLCKLCAQNHGEEIDGDVSNIIPVQCLGGSVIGGNYPGGLIIVGGRATPIYTTFLSEKYAVIIGVPKDYEHPDSAQLMRQEEENMDGFVESGQTYAKDIAYKLVHEVLPDLYSHKFDSCKELIYQYRWNMGSIKNCSFALPRINYIAEKLRKYRNDKEIIIFSLSSVGPGFFAITTNPKKVIKDFEQMGMKTIITSIYNGTYKIGE